MIYFTDNLGERVFFKIFRKDELPSTWQHLSIGGVVGRWETCVWNEGRKSVSGMYY